VPHKESCCWKGSRRRRLRIVAEAALDVIQPAFHSEINRIIIRLARATTGRTPLAQGNLSFAPFATKRFEDIVAQPDIVRLLPSDDLKDPSTLEALLEKMEKGAKIRTTRRVDGESPNASSSPSRGHGTGFCEL
jgi:hypothetical protein